MTTGDALKANAQVTRDKIELWFFRDLVDTRRNKLFSLFGLGEIPTMGAQKKALRHILAALSVEQAPQPPAPEPHMRGDLYDAEAFMADGGDTPMTAAEAVLAWLLIEKIGVPDDVGYSPNQAQKIIVRRLDLARELEEIDAMLVEGQGDDEGHPIMPEFTKSMTTYARVEACLHLLERRRDALHADPAPTEAPPVEQSQAARWQPIKTADKDAASLMLGIFRKGNLEEIHLGGYRYAFNEDEVSCWWSDQADDEIVPTHWMPPPPALAAEGRE